MSNEVTRSKVSDGKRHDRGIGAHQGPADVARQRQPAFREVEAEGTAVAAQRAEVVTGAAAAVEHAQGRAAGGHAREHRTQVAAEAVVPEVIGLGLAGQVEQTVHRRGAV